MSGRFPRTSPTVRRRRLASELRRLRKEQGKTREEAAKYAGIAPATVTRMEAALHAPKPADVLALCRLYGLDDRRTELLVTFARQSRQRGWWQRYGGAIPDWFAFYVGLEEEAAEIRTYQPELVLGLFQTEAYIRAVMRSGITVPDGDELERKVSVRLKRQERLTEAGPIDVWAVLHESALRTEVGGRAVMREQLHHLVELSWRNNITLQVLPFSAGSHPGNAGAFELFSFAEPADPEVVYVQYRLGCLYLEDSSDINAYSEVFDHLRARALSPDDSRAILDRIAGEMI
ncbi:helix-turn-helix protein [Actinocorallia herbida]|uniref:Helix-turn-helix protein n=1 Tax=Actinocorallia herbida TaxID=58109 RepID=A0A3N1CR13_9ACTN|nr:helix-turn-helix transcriptional regulator [Actinocorallia herbida]ROO83743.1 helix-turn-helix protein [Actinocorallia herbida]